MLDSQCGLNNNPDRATCAAFQMPRSGVSPLLDQPEQRLGAVHVLLRREPAGLKVVAHCELGGGKERDVAQRPFEPIG
jgi:hypothetical protein